MKLIKRLLKNIKSRKYSTSRIRKKFLLKDYKYLKQAFRNSSSYLKVQAVEYLSDFKTQSNFEFLIEEFKTINDTKLKSYTYQSILIILQEENIVLSENDRKMLDENRSLLKNIRIVKQVKSNSTSSVLITFRDRNKDLMKELEDKKKITEKMIGF